MKLKHDELLSNFAFNCNLRHYIKKQVGVPTPCQVVLLQELDRYNQLVAKMLSTLKNLQKALSGEIGMSGDLDLLATALSNGALPDTWMKMTAATEKKLGSWILWFERRYQQYKVWVEKGEPTVMWLSGLHIPETYTAALVQTACRTKQWWGHVLHCLNLGVLKHLAFSS